MNYKRIILLTALVAMQLVGFGQHSGNIKDSVNVSKFPEISLIYHNNNPQKFDSTYFYYVKDNGSEVDFTITSLPQNISNEVQNTVILWEDMAHNGSAQFNFTKDALKSFINDRQFTANDKFALYEFNRVENKKPALSNLLPNDEFTSDKNVLLSAINSNTLSKITYPQFANCSDIYTAIREAIDILEPLSGAKSIILFTAGRPMTSSGADSESQVGSYAQANHIPVYIFQYYNTSGIATATEGFATNTYGKFGSYKESGSAAKDLIALYPQIKQRYFGQDYQITFTSKASRGDNSQIITLKTKGSAEISASYLPPEFSLWLWIKENIALSIVALMGILGLLFLIIYSLTKKRKAPEESPEPPSDTNPPQPPVIHITPQQPPLPNTIIDKDEVPDSKEMANWMSVKNINPRLDYRGGHTRQIFNIKKAQTTIGSAEDNILILPFSTVSRHHAEIVFTQSRGFEIVDKGSTNKVIVNGYRSDRCVLKSGDTIALGEVVMIFYM